MKRSDANGGDLPATRGGAAVAEGRVAVVAFLLAGVDVAIAAGRSFAGDRAVVARARVAVVALFGALHDAVAADGLLARAQAFVCVGLVAVVAFFFPGVDETVPATGDGARGRAIVGVVVIAVVAFFFPGVDETVPAARFDARREAGVLVVVVSVVAFLIGIDLAVAARRGDTIASSATALALGHGGLRPIRTADVERVILTERITRVALEALGDDRLASRPVLAARVALDALGVDRPLSAVTDPELAAS
ncbi:MAG: hypothetical protein DIU78_024290 [Pseudomonadota bacterium]